MSGESTLVETQKVGSKIGSVCNICHRPPGTSEFFTDCDFCTFRNCESKKCGEYLTEWTGIPVAYRCTDCRRKQEED